MAVLTGPRACRTSLKPIVITLVSPHDRRREFAAYLNSYPNYAPAPLSSG